MKRRALGALAVSAAAMLAVAPASAQDKVKIGYAISKTGPNAGGASITQIPNYEMWVKDVNAKGGLLIGGKRVPIEVVEYDDRSNSEEAVRAVERLVTQDKVDLLFHNDRVVVGRKGHPRRHATSLAELVGEDWVLTGVRERVEAEFEDAFASQGLPPPVPMTQAESMVGVAALLSSTDALAMLPRQWLQAALFEGVIEAIPVREHIEGPDIVQISRAGVPLTPAAAYLSTLFERAAVGM